jgi:hypothetical protein
MVLLSNARVTARVSSFGQSSTSTSTPSPQSGNGAASPDWQYITLTARRKETHLLIVDVGGSLFEQASSRPPACSTKGVTTQTKSDWKVEGGTAAEGGPSLTAAPPTGTTNL